MGLRNGRRAGADGDRLIAPLEREISRRLNLAAARLRHIAGTAWSTKRYLNIGLLKDQQMRGAITA